MSAKYPKRSVPELRAELETPKKRDYEGAAGLGSYYSNLLDLITDRGIMVVPDVATLSLLTGNDAKLVAVKSVGLYAFNPSATVVNNPLNYPATGGGYWEYLVALGKTSYSEVIGDSVVTVWTITHNLNTLTPTVLQMEADSPGGGAPYAYVTNGVVSVDDANTITITYSSAPATHQYTIVVKK